MALSSILHPRHYDYQYHIRRTLVTVAQSSDGRARLQSFNSRIQGVAIHPMTPDKCFVISEKCRALRHSLRHSLVLRTKSLTKDHSFNRNDGVGELANSAHGSLVEGELVTVEEAVEWVNREVHDPMVEVDPVTVTGQILAEKEAVSAEDISTSIKTTSLRPFYQNPRGFNWIIMAVAFALTLGIVVAISQILELRKTNNLHQPGAGSETKKMTVMEETIHATLDASEDKRAASAAQKQKLKQSFIGRFESKRLNEETLSNYQGKQVEKIVRAEQKSKPKYVTEGLSHADASPPLPVLLPVSLIDNVDVDARKNQNGGTHSVGPVDTNVYHPSEKEQIGEKISLQDSKISFPDQHNFVEISTDTSASYDSSVEFSARPAPTAEPEPEFSETEMWVTFKFPARPTPIAELEPETSEIEIVEESGPREWENFNKALQAAVPAVAVGIGAVGALAGVAGGLQVVGFAATACLLTRDLIWAQTREQLWQDLRNITDRQKLQEFLAKRDILPESRFNGASFE